MKNLFTICLFFFALFYVKAQNNNTTTSKDSIKTTQLFFNPLKEKISIRANFSSDIRSYSFTDSESSLSLQPNGEYKTNITIDYRFFGITLGFSPKFLPENDDTDLKGETEFSSIGFQFYFDNWLQRVSYERTKGFYIKNTGDFIENWRKGTDAYIQFPGLRITTYTGNTAYKFNKNFSHSAVNGYIQWQLKSAGSFIPSLNYNYTNIRINGLGDDSETKSNEFNITFEPSYYYTFVYKTNWFFSLEASPGLGINFAKETTTDLPTNRKEKDNNNFPYYTYDGALILGYNSSSFYAGARYDFKNLSNFNKSEENLLETNSYFEFHIGYRFDAPKMIKKTFDWIEETTGL